MAYRPQAVPRGWNSYRPSHEPISRDDDRPWHPDTDKRLPSYRSTRREPERPSPRDHDNPNNIPVAHRESHPISTPLHTPIPDQPDDSLPKLWDADLDHLMGTTSRAYQLVINYEKQSMGGKRWTREEIDRIHYAGRYLDPDMRALRHLRHMVAESAQDDPRLRERIERGVAGMREYCAHIQTMIKEYERVPENQKEKLSGAGAQQSPLGFVIKGVAGGRRRDETRAGGNGQYLTGVRDRDEPLEDGKYQENGVENSHNQKIRTGRDGAQTRWGVSH